MARPNRLSLRTMRTSTGDAGPAGGRGKWSIPGVPHRGWTCVDMEDLGEPAQVCEMCESSHVRFVHFMSHQRYPAVLKVGCVCAGHMEENYAAAQGRDSRMQSRAARRARWLTRRWRTSARGNEWIRSDGFRVTVQHRADGWAVSLAREDTDDVYHGRRRFRTSAAAKLAAFDAITRLGQS